MNRFIFWDWWSSLLAIFLVVTSSPPRSLETRRYQPRWKTIEAISQFITVDVLKNLGELNYQCNHFRFLLQLRDKGTNIQLVPKQSQLYTKLKAGLCSWGFTSKTILYFLESSDSAFMLLGVRGVQLTACTWFLAFPASTTKCASFLKYLLH